jgi:aminoglycoside phosphotransferase (APT) family kinase protein
VLDWELCTLGDVRADVGMLMVYWVEPDDTLHPLADPPTSIGGFASRRQILDGYRKASGQDLPEIDYFVAFASWRLACIIEGVYARYHAAAMGSHIPDDIERFARTVDQLVARAAAILDGQPAV